MIDRDRLTIFSKHAMAFADGLQEACDRYDINTGLRVCHFLAQLAHESMEFTRLEENLNYSGERLLAVFPHYFKTMDQVDRYAHKPKAIGSRVYGGRNGNGDETSGDGYRYRGRGLIGLTFKDNYRAARDGLRRAVPAVPDFVDEPDTASSLHWAPMIAGWYWDTRRVNVYADRDDLIAVTKAINGGLIGIQDRGLWLGKAKAAFGVTP